MDGAPAGGARRCLWALVVAAALLAACGGQAAAPAAQPDWSGVEATLSVDRLAGIVQDTPEPAAPETLPLAEARARLPFNFGVPAWAPEGFALLDEAEVTAPSSVTLAWRNANDDILTLEISSASGSAGYAAGARTVEPARVSGQPAMLVHSGALGRRRLSLIWQMEDVSYSLSAEETVILTDGLVRMAESVR